MYHILKDILQNIYVFVILLLCSIYLNIETIII